MDLLKGSHVRNTRAGITGLLLFKNGHFMQLLEGDEAAVIALFSKISRDPRHHHVIILWHGTVDQRDFADSAMAFHNLETEDLRGLPGYSEFLNTPLDEEYWKDISKCKRLLLNFKMSEPPEIPRSRVRWK